MNRHCIENDNSTTYNICYDCDICDGNDDNIIIIILVKTIIITMVNM